jgi:Ni,Fe-hydrogenase I small subunit
MQKPRTGERATVLLRRSELPVAGRFESDACEVCAGAVGGVLSVGNCAAWINVDAHDDADCAVNGVSGSLRNIRHVPVQDIAAGC